MQTRAERPSLMPAALCTVGLLTCLTIYMTYIDPLFMDSDHDLPDDDGGYFNQLKGEILNGDWDPRDPDFLERLMNALLRVGIPAAIIASIIGVSIGTIRRWQNGGNAPLHGKLSVLQQIKKFFQSAR